VAVVGDGALTGGVSWEAINNVGADTARPLIIVLNDNGRSYAPTVGGLAAHLADIRGRPRRSEVLTGLGLDCIGPVDGHDITALEAAFRQARDRGRAVLVHCVTQKGRGYPPAEADQADHLHGPPPFDPATGRPRQPPRSSWTAEFGAHLVRLAEDDPRIVAITAAMPGPVGLTDFARRFPDRMFDVGIAEQHAAAMSAGLALGGLHPVLCLYATFVNRAFDQLLMDIALHRLPVTLVLDRAGVTGEDGPSHHGMWDLALLTGVPGLRIAAPRDPAQLRGLLTEAVAIDGPTAIRFPKGEAGPEIAAQRRVGGVDVLCDGGPGGTLLVTAGAMAPVGVDAARLLAVAGLKATVVDPRWLAPVPAELVNLARHHRLVVTVEDGCRDGGFGSTLRDALDDAGIHVPLTRLGLPRRFHEHGKRKDILAAAGLTARAVALATERAAA